MRLLEAPLIEAPPIEAPPIEAPLIEAPPIEAPSLKASSASVEKVACSFVKSIIVGASEISKAKNPEQEITQTPSQCRDPCTLYNFFKGQANKHGQKSIFWWTMASFAALMVKRKQKQYVDKSELLRMRKWGTVIIGVMNGLAQTWGRKALRVWMCLCCTLVSWKQLKNFTACPKLTSVSCRKRVQKNSF
jgi:hypothetical protein